MSPTRALLTALLTAVLVRVQQPDEAAWAILAWAAAWLLTSDPLPDAIERGLDAFARRYRR